MLTFLAFEQPLAELHLKMDELRDLHQRNPALSLMDEIKKLEKKADSILVGLYKNISPWEKVQVARHAMRPHAKDYIHGLCEDFVPLAGDRLFGEDKAVIGGMGRISGISALVIGTEKGHDTQSRITHNFGMANPEGYRKAIRLMQLADRFGLPVVTFVDTAGAYPGRGAEERGQAEAIAKSIHTSLGLRVPLISVIIGEGGSGGAIALACGNHVIMLEHAVYSVISPEGAASILWRDAAMAQQAATSMRITAQDLLGFGIIDEILAEPVGGAHRNPPQMIRAVGDAITAAFEKLLPVAPAALQVSREEKFLMMTADLAATE